MSNDGKYNIITEGSIILWRAKVQYDNGGKYNIVTMEPKGHHIIKIPLFY
jgi:hypothetical protein